jgi:formamidopyrimidine-DNA glycosylase
MYSPMRLRPGVRRCAIMSRRRVSSDISSTVSRSMAAQGSRAPGCDCGQSVQRIVQSGRSTFYCTKRQR